MGPRGEGGPPRLPPINGPGPLDRIGLGGPGPARRGHRRAAAAGGAVHRDHAGRLSGGAPADPAGSRSCSAVLRSSAVAGCRTGSMHAAKMRSRRRRASFNQAAQRIEDLVRSNRSLLANASHELRSPLARLKMAVSMFDHADPAQHEELRREIDRDLGCRARRAGRGGAAGQPARCALGHAAPSWSICSACWSRRPRGSGSTSARKCRCSARSGCLPRAAQPAGERASLRRRRGLGRRRHAAGRPHRDQHPRSRPRRAGGVPRAHLRALLPPARPCRACGRRRPRAVAGAPDRRAPRRQGACEGREGGGTCFVITLPGPMLGDDAPAPGRHSG